eukprot:CAMPEP_0119132806 /NCGR_PEP_ID=MMETSP1310-20130426/12336_1 /TAXON_ID=464262 /ORGANISM="Genus nov. species nov., Strain RCC2339" /LENGTH=745 /DNA_ID=CAMNT_0007123463 /DNA_START=90 /DNA_END=2330 /DNA_ORIENTATION=-
MMKVVALALCMAVLCFQAGKATQSEVLINIIKTGKVRCAVGSSPLFTDSDEPQNLQNPDGFDSLFCAALAGAIFGTEKLEDAQSFVNYISVSSSQRFDALTANEPLYDVLTATSTNTMERDIYLGTTFIRPSFYDGQGFLVKTTDNYECFSGCQFALADDELTYCVTSGTTSEVNIKAALQIESTQDNTIVGYDTGAEAVDAFNRGNCSVATGDKSTLAAFATSDAKILSQDISREPLSAAVKDRPLDDFGALVRWVRNALIVAEMCNLDSSNKEPNPGAFPECFNLLDVTNSGLLDNDGTTLKADMFASLLLAIGNYGTIYDGAANGNFENKLPRAEQVKNELFSDGNGVFTQRFNPGGLQYAGLFYWPNPAETRTVRLDAEDVIYKIRTGEQKLRCGVGTDHPLMARDLDTDPAGFEVDLCRAIVAAISAVELDCFVVVGGVDCDTSSIDVANLDRKIEYVPVVEANGVEKLVFDKSIDVLMGRTSANIENDIKFRMHQSSPYFYDNAIVLQNFVNQSSYCAIQGTVAEVYADWIFSDPKENEKVICSSLAQCVEMLDSGRCGNFVDMSNVIYYVNTVVTNSKVRRVELPLARFPLTIASRDGDQDLGHLIEWIVNGLVLAEELGIEDASEDAIGCTDLLFVGAPIDEKCYILLRNNGLEFVRGEFMTSVLTVVGHYGNLWNKHFGDVIPARFANQFAADNSIGLLYSPPWTSFTVEYEEISSAATLAPATAVLAFVLTVLLA